jgi:hypothetical protein
MAIQRMLAYNIREFIETLKSTHESIPQLKIHRLGHGMCWCTLVMSALKRLKQ